MARQAVCHGLRDGACHREPAAVAQPQDKAAPAAARRPAWPRAAGAPSVLGTRAGGKSQVAASRVPLGADGAPGGVAQGGAVRKAMRAGAGAPGRLQRARALLLDCMLGKLAALEGDV